MKHRYNNFKLVVLNRESILYDRFENFNLQLMCSFFWKMHSKNRNIRLTKQNKKKNLYIFIILQIPVKRLNDAVFPL